MYFGIIGPLLLRFINDKNKNEVVTNIDSILHKNSEILEKLMNEQIAQVAAFKIKASQDQPGNVAVPIPKPPQIPRFDYEVNRLNEHDYTVNTLGKISGYLT